MLVLSSSNQYFIQIDKTIGGQKWSYDIEEATLYYESALELLIDLVESRKDLRIEIINLLGNVVYTNYAKEERISEFLS